MCHIINLLPILFIYATFALKNICNYEPSVKIKHGDIVGTLMMSKSGRCFHAYRGIPYAKPPIGDLRFKAPVEPSRWYNVLNATKDASQCIQQNYLFSQEPEVEGSEDCLYLNVYTPKIRRQGENLLPVMVFIHYGAFFAGSGRSDVHGPEYFMDKDIILVTFNYRLGVFGFLSTYDDAAPGNWAFKDQIAVLRWVQSNIVYFGGNRKKVTIFGQSAGGGSTHHHILSPLSRGLFHAAISQSGSALALWAKPQREISAEIAKAQATFVGCRNDTDSYVMVNCLRKVPAYQLVLSAELFRFLRSEPLNVFMLTIETQTELNPEPFITEDPIDIIRKGQFQNVPWIIGVVAEEGILRAAPFVHHQDILENINDNFENIVPNMLSLSLSTDNIPTMWEAVKKFYFPKNKIDAADAESIKGLIDIYSDRAFLYPAYQSALFHAWSGHEKIWFYNFEYKGYYSYGDLFAASNKTINYDWGVSHCDDLIYLFTSKYFLPLKVSSDKEMNKNMISLFTNFATYGEPTPRFLLGRYKNGWDPIPNIVGKQSMENGDLHYLKITGKYDGESTIFEMKNSFYSTRMSFWEKLPLYENIPNLH